MKNDNQKQVYKRYDKAYKKLMSNPYAFCRFMRSLVDEELAQKVTPENIEMINKRFITEQGLEYESDLIYKVSLNPDCDAYFIILMEFQSGPDKTMAYRMLNYVVQFWGSLTRRDNFPAVFPVVFYNGERKWVAKTDILECVENTGIPEKYIPKMSYLSR